MVAYRFAGAGGATAPAAGGGGDFSLLPACAGWYNFNIRFLINMIDKSKEHGIDFSDLDKGQVFSVLDEKQFSPRALIDSLKMVPEFRELMDANAGVYQGYTIEEHTLMVMRQFEKYFADKNLPNLTDTGFFRIMLALHDIGKPIAIRNGDKRLQHGETVPIVRLFLGYLKYDRPMIDLATALLSDDPIGEYFKKEIPLKEVKERLMRMSEAASISSLELFRILKIVYMSDAGSYTVDAGGTKSLDHIFAFRPDEREMDFAEPFKTYIAQIEEALTDQGF